MKVGDKVRLVADLENDFYVCGLSIGDTGVILKYSAKAVLVEVEPGTSFYFSVYELEVIS